MQRVALPHVTYYSFGLFRLPFRVQTMAAARPRVLRHTHRDSTETNPRATDWSHRSLCYSGPIHIETTLSSLLRTKWLDPRQGWFSERPGSELDDAVKYSTTTTSEELFDSPDAIVGEILRYILFSVNWSTLVDTQERLEDLVRQGREFNQANLAPGVSCKTNCQVYTSSV
jgi:hypothetical protein